MIELIIQSYYNTFLATGIASGIIFLYGLYLIFIKPHRPKKVPVVKAQMPAPDTKKNPHVISISSKDFTAIAGDDVMATQLDLARAYIETGRKQLAKKILEYVVEQGSDAQQEEAQRLISYT